MARVAAWRQPVAGPKEKDMHTGSDRAHGQLMFVLDSLGFLVFALTWQVRPGAAQCAAAFSVPPGAGAPRHPALPLDRNRAPKSCTPAQV